MTDLKKSETRYILNFSEGEYTAEGDFVSREENQSFSLGLSVKRNGVFIGSADYHKGIDKQEITTTVNCLQEGDKQVINSIVDKVIEESGIKLTKMRETAN